MCPKDVHTDGQERFDGTAKNREETWGQVRVVTAILCVKSRLSNLRRATLVSVEPHVVLCPITASRETFFPIVLNPLVA